MLVCTSLQTDNHASTPLLSFFTVRMPFLPLNQQHQSTEGIEDIGREEVFDITVVVIGIGTAPCVFGSSMVTGIVRVGLLQ